MWRTKKIISNGGILLCGVSLLAGCATSKTTTTARSATEQLLISTATDHALLNSGLGIFAGRTVYLDTTYFDSYDSKYVLGAIRDALSRAGALLQDNAASSDIIIEARSGALAINDSESLVGLPSMTVPVPLSGPLQTPEIPFYKADKQHSIAKIALLAYVRQSREHVYSSGPLDGKSDYRAYKLFFLSWKRTDIPEKYSDEDEEGEEGAKYQTWFRQVDLENLNHTNAPATLSAAASTNAPAKKAP